MEHILSKVPSNYPYLMLAKGEGSPDKAHVFLILEKDVLC